MHIENASIYLHSYAYLHIYLYQCNNGDHLCVSPRSECLFDILCILWMLSSYLGAILGLKSLFWIFIVHFISFMWSIYILVFAYIVTNIYGVPSAIVSSWQSHIFLNIYMNTCLWLMFGCMLFQCLIYIFVLIFKWPVSNGISYINNMKENSFTNWTSKLLKFS